MNFTSIPEAYASFQEPLLYAFDTQAKAHDVEVKIRDVETLEVIGRKILYGATTGEVDIAPYLRQRMQINLPEGVAGCGEVELNQQINVVVEVDDVSSAERCYIAAKVSPGLRWQLLTSQIEHRTMACDEFDLISYFAHPDVEVEVVVESLGKSGETMSFTPTSRGQCAVAVMAQGLGEEPDELKVTIKVDGHEQAQINYVIKPNLKGARRLAWLNEHLSPEIYTFPLRKGVLVKAVRRHMESVWGREAAALESENELKLISAYEPKAQIEALAEILSSKKVWLVENGVPQSVNLVTDRVLPTSCGEMGMIEVDIRAAEKGVKLW